MKRSLILSVIALAALSVLAVPAFSQAPKKADIAGTWVGTAVTNADGSQLEIVVVFVKTASGYTGKLSDTAGMVPESELKEIVLKDNKLTCTFDLVQATQTIAIKIELTLEGETLKGAWSDEAGESGSLELTLKK